MRAALYIRVSTAEQAKEGFSLAAQENHLRKYADAMGYQIHGVYVDDGYSGKDLNRPQIKLLLNDIKFEKIDIILIYKLDRLIRSVKSLLELVDLFQKYNISLYSLNESIDLTSPFGRAALKMSGTFSELERETIIERSKLGKEQRAKEGLAMRHYCLPIGYDYDEKNKMFTPHPYEAEQVKKIFEMYLQGWNYSQLSKYMNQNYKNRYLSYNDRTAVGRILRNPFSAGYFYYNGVIYKAKNIVPIITYETWLKAEAIRLNNLKTKIRPDSPYLLTGLLYCGKCGRRYCSKKYRQVQKNKNGTEHEYLRYAYGCQARVKHEKRFDGEKCDNIIIPQKTLEEYIINIIKNLKITGFKMTTKDNALSNIQIQMTEIKAKQDKLLDLYMDNLITKNQYEIRLKKLEDELKKQENLFIKEKENVVATPDIDVDAINHKIADWDNLDMFEKRLLLKCLIKKITINDENINVELLVDTL